MKDCQDYTLDFERSLIERLSIKERIGLRFHSTICPDCRKYFIESRIIDKLLAKRFKDRRQFHFTPEEKARIKEKLLS